MREEYNEKIELDLKTANAFANSWNNLPIGSIYTSEQFEDWMTPLSEKDISNKTVLELGCGNGSLMVHLINWKPKIYDGVDLGDSVITAKKNLETYKNVSIIKDDLVTFSSETKYDIVYCIGVLHHLQEPKKGFDSVIRNTKPGGKFHCWVYAKEGNFVIRLIVDPLRKVASNLPWWVTKYALATPLVFPYYVYAKTLIHLPRWVFLKCLPLYDYALWIGKREYAFFRHIAFDQLVTPQTTYIPKKVIEEWLRNSSVQKGTSYIVMRNGNSWKFGGVKK